MFGLKRREKRDASFSQSARSSFLTLLGMNVDASISREQALGIPAVWAAVNFLSGTMAGLPLNVYERDRKGNKRKLKSTPANPIVSMLHDAANDNWTSFQWRFDTFNAVLTEGRAVSYIERDSSGEPINLFPIVGASVKRGEDGRKTYFQSRANGKEKEFDQSEVLDMTFMLADDLLSHRSPLDQCSVALGKASHANKFGSKLFGNGGIPLMSLQGPFSTGQAANRAQDDIAGVTKRAAEEGKSVIAMPLGHELKPLGIDPEKMQLLSVQEFSVIEIGRIFSLPPTFLQDLSRATFSNSEQQDLHLVKHTLKRWVEQFEAEMNLKFFGRNSRRFVEFNMDGLLRGDYKTRMEGNSTAIQTGQLTPNEARAMDNREPLKGGDNLLIQGATVPLDGHTGKIEQKPKGENDGI